MAVSRAYHEKQYIFNGTTSAAMPYGCAFTNVTP